LARPPSLPASLPQHTTREIDAFCSSGFRAIRSASLPRIRSNLSKRTTSNTAAVASPPCPSSSSSSPLPLRETDASVAAPCFCCSLRTTGTGPYGGRILAWNPFTVAWHSRGPCSRLRSKQKYKKDDDQRGREDGRKFWKRLIYPVHSPQVPPRRSRSSLLEQLLVLATDRHVAAQHHAQFLHQRALHDHNLPVGTSTRRRI
jgi:hypothetical protein